MRNIISRNPFSGEIKEQFAYFSNEVLQKCLQRSASAFALHSKRTAKEKMNMIEELVPQIIKKKNEIARLITFETGKPIIEAQNEVKQAVQMCQYYSKHSQAILSLNIKAMARKKTLIKYLPTGSVYCILPFTSPFSLAFYHSLPQLLLGNCVVVKHSATTPSISRIVEKIMVSSGFQSGEYQHCFAGRDQTEDIVSKSLISGISFTGSTQAGREVASIAGRFLKPSAMHLSSNDSIIITEGADLSLAINSLLRKETFNSGQGGPKRIIIKDSIYEEFKIRLVERVKQLKYGDPFEKETEIGPISRTDLYQTSLEQLKTLQSSFKIVYQRQNIEKPFFPATIVEGQKQVFDEQVMAPVFFLYRAADSAQIIRLANSTRFGSKNHIFGQKSEEIAPYLDGGCLFINQSDCSSCNVPRGGTRQSGYGREGGQEGIRTFANIKTVYIN